MKTIGAWATIKWRDTGETLAPVYFSFGLFDDDSQHDSFGVSDDRIFFYCEDEHELRQLMTDGMGNDFTVLDYETEVMP